MVTGLNVFRDYFADITDFILRLENDPFDVNTLINYGVTTEEIAGRLSATFI